jgi:hypothetical protein
MNNPRVLGALCWLWLFCGAIEARAQSSAGAPIAACVAADLDKNFQFMDEPGDVTRLTLSVTNISKTTCLLGRPNYPCFVDQNQPNRRQVDYCDRCKEPIPGGELPSNAPIQLEPNGAAHQTLRWRTVAAKDSPACIQIAWISASSEDMKHAFLLVTPSLIKAVCSPVDVVGYLPGPSAVPTIGAKQSPRSQASIVQLSALRQVYYQDERFELHAEMERDAGKLGTTTQCPSFFLRERSPDGNARIDEIAPRDVNCSDSQNVIKANFDAGALSRWGGVGDHVFQALALQPGAATFEESNRLTIPIRDEALIARVWGPIQQGVHVNLTLDKLTYSLGEDIALRIGAEVVSEDQAVYGSQYGRGGAFFMSIAPGFHLIISDSDGPLPGSDARSNLYSLVGGSSGPSVCTPPLPVGKVLALDRSAKAYGLLPKRPGTYTLVVTWSPYKTKYASCNDVPRYDPAVPSEQPFVTVSSLPLTIRVVGEEPHVVGAAPLVVGPPPSVVGTAPSDGIPEYTGWKSKFSLSTTSFGEKTALLDKATHLEWLRLSLTHGQSEEALSAMMQPTRELAGWRFATRSEVRAFIADFTGTPDGHTNNPAIERKLQRLLGGLDTGPAPSTGWSRRAVYGHIAGYEPDLNHKVPAVLPTGTPVPCPTCGYGFITHSAYIADDSNNGQISVTVDPDQQGWCVGKFSFALGTFLVREQ